MPEREAVGMEHRAGGISGFQCGLVCLVFRRNGTGRIWCGPGERIPQFILNRIRKSVASGVVQVYPSCAVC